MLKPDQRSSPGFRLQFRGRGIFIKDHLAVTPVLSIGLDMNLPETQPLGIDVIMLSKRRSDLGILPCEQPFKSEIEPSRNLDDGAAVEYTSIEVAQCIHLKDRFGLIKIL